MSWPGRCCFEHQKGQGAALVSNSLALCLLLMTWAEAAQSHFLQGQAESESIEEAEAIRSQSLPRSDFSDADSEPLFLPEMYWVAPIKHVVDTYTHHLPLDERLNRSGRKLRIVSACSGTLAEASVLQAGWICLVSCV